MSERSESHRGTMSHNNSICKFRNYSRDSSLAAHDFSTKFRRHLFYRGQPSPAFRDAESVRRQLSRGGRQTAAQKRGWGGGAGNGCRRQNKGGDAGKGTERCTGGGTESNFRQQHRGGDESGGAGNGCRRQNRGGDAAEAQRGMRAAAQRGVRATAQRGVRATAQRAATDDGTERCAGGARRADADGGTEAGIVAGAQRRNADGRGGARQPAGRRG